MLETQISPIFGLTLLGMLEFVAILSIIISGVAFGFSIHNHIIAKKTTSAKIMLEMSKRMERQDFRDTVEFLHLSKKPKDDWNAEIEVEKLLTYFDDMGLYESEGILKIEHIDQMHRYTLELLKQHDLVKKILKKYEEKEKEKNEEAFYFVFTKKLFARYP